MKRRRHSTSLFEMLNAGRENDPPVHPESRIRELTGRETTTAARRRLRPVEDRGGDLDPRLDAGSGRDHRGPLPARAPWETASPEVPEGEVPEAGSRDAGAGPYSAGAGSMELEMPLFRSRIAQEISGIPEETAESQEEFAESPQEDLESAMQQVSVQEGHAASDAESAPAHGARLSSLPPLPARPVATGTAGIHSRSVWAWLNRTREVRHVSCLVWGSAIVLFLCLSYQMGKRNAEPAHYDPITNSSMGVLPGGEVYGKGDDSRPLNPATENSKASVRNVVQKGGGAAVSEKVVGKKYYVVKVCTTRSNDGANKLKRYLEDADLPWPLDCKDIREGATPLWEIFYGPMETRADAKAALTEIRKLRASFGTDFTQAQIFERTRD